MSLPQKTFVLHALFKYDVIQHTHSVRSLVDGMGWPMTSREIGKSWPMTSREIGKLTLRLYRERYGYDARPDRQEIIAKEGVSSKVHNVFYTKDHDLIEA